VECATSDAAAAKAFYGELFGWTYDDRPIGGGAVYSMARLDGEDVAAVYASEQAPHWNSYVTVESAEAAAERARAAGGDVAAEPFDVMDAGRMSVIADPAGAALCVWEPRANVGAGLVNVPGALTWNDLMTTDVAAACAFYGEVFGWTFQAVPGAPGDRVVIRNGDRTNGGIARLPEGMEGVPPAWAVFFAVEDAAAGAARATEQGGRLLMGPMPVPAGRLAIVADPQGAVLGLSDGEADPDPPDPD